MRSVMNHNFSQVPQANIQRSRFDRSHGVKTTFDADYLVPILVDDIIPGDTFSVTAQFFARLATPLDPIMDNMYLDTFFFFVPYRTIWDNHEKFHGAQDDPGDSIDFNLPILGGTNDFETGSLADYFGIPVGTNYEPANIPVSALPFRAYNKIYNDWFRDENLQDSLNVLTGNGPDTYFDTNSVAGYSLRKRGKRHDYFTSALPQPQKGTAVSLPLGTTADIYADPIGSGSLSLLVEDGLGGSTRDLVGTGADVVMNAVQADGHVLKADLAGATAATINDIRLAVQTQRLLERDSRAGTRYVEVLRAHWGVTSPDFRLQRAEFLGGGSSPVNITPVAQTSAQPVPAADDTLGQLAGFGTVSGEHGFTKSFVEHGVLIGLMNVRGDLTYSQGLERFWSKRTRYETYYPALAQIGEQATLNREIYCDPADGQDEAVWGYQGRYDEYRYKPSKLTGLFRPGISGSLSSWTVSEEFTTRPTLGATFIESNLGVPLDNAIAIPSEPHFKADIFFKMKCARPMPLFGVPGNMDRF